VNRFILGIRTPLKPAMRRALDGKCMGRDQKVVSISGNSQTRLWAHSALDGGKRLKKKAFGVEVSGVSHV